jgi:hypothetical protein
MPRAGGTRTAHTDQFPPGRIMAYVKTHAAEFSDPWTSNLRAIAHSPSPTWSVKRDYNI